MKRLLVVAALAVGLAMPARGQDFEKGMQAYERGDFVTALREWRPLAEQGNAVAQTLLGNSYAQGEGVPIDHAKAEKWYRKAALQGDSNGQYYLGFTYWLRGGNDPESYADAFTWYSKAAAQDHADAQKQLGDMYYHGTGVPRSPAIASSWWRQAAEGYGARALEGDTSAQRELGDLYFLGRGVSENEKTAAEWWRKAAESGDALGQWALAGAYSRGQGVPQDYRQAVYWWRKAAEQGQWTSQANLGTMYEQGQGVPQDYVQAHMWYNIAATQYTGSKWPAEQRDKLTKQMTPEQVAEAQRLAREWQPKPKQC